VTYQGDPYMFALTWIRDEHDYQTNKTSAETDDARTRDNSSAYLWREKIDMYLNRAAVLGIDTDVGRQAVAKAAATAVGYLESVVRVHGSVPEPGVPSGDHIHKLRYLLP
jgi:hypothetical protein